MSGIRFLVDERGQRTAVLIDLKKHGELWEDLYDTWIAARRSREPRETLASVKQRLRRQGKLNGGK